MDVERNKGNKQEGSSKMTSLTVTKEKKVGLISLQRPPANALSNDLLTALSDALDQVETAREIRVVLLHGEGKFFSAGADIKEFTSIQNNVESSSMSENGQKLFERIETFSKPVIAAIHGAALGGGLELAMSCHLRLASENAQLGLPELQLGLIPGFGGTQRLPRYVGSAKAAEMMFTSEPITGKEAVQWGLVNHAYPEEVLMEKAKMLANRIAEKSPASLRAVIELLNYEKSNSFYQGINREMQLFEEIFLSEDAKEGIQAFIEKRSPTFVGD